jgi:hypothetical protein
MRDLLELPARTTIATGLKTVDEVTMHSNDYSTTLLMPGVALHRDAEQSPRGKTTTPPSPCHGGSRLSSKAQSEVSRNANYRVEMRLKVGVPHTPPVSETARRRVIAATANHPQPKWSSNMDSLPGSKARNTLAIIAHINTNTVIAMPKAAQGGFNRALASHENLRRRPDSKDNEPARRQRPTESARCTGRSPTDL